MQPEDPVEPECVTSAHMAPFGPVYLETLLLI